MMRRVQWGLAAFVAVVLSACQTLPQVPYDRTTAGNLKTINVVTPVAPERAGVILATSVGQSFGLIGALIDAGMQSSRESDFEAITKARNFSGRDALLRYTDAALKANGYGVNSVAVARPSREFLKAYPAAEGDAYLDVLMNYGYLATGIATPYRPFVYVECRLVRASDKQTLMQRTVVYNPLGAVPEQAVTVAPDPAYVFDDFDALKNDPEKAVRGVDLALEQVANAIGTLLR
jgi:hypothetical protein